MPHPERKPKGLIEKLSLEHKLVGGTADLLGFRGFRGKVADIGTRDGRNIPLLYKLGAEEVYAIDPNKEDLTLAVSKGLLDETHAIPEKLESVVTQFKGTFDVAVVFNYNIPFLEQKHFTKCVGAILKPRGQVIFTFVNKDEYMNASLYFDNVFTETKEASTYRNSHPDLYMFVGTKKSDHEIIEQE